MDISSTEAQGGVVQLQAVSRANQLAVQQQAKVLTALGMSVNNPAPNVTTSASYSPALYAQAAQYQLYTQSGTLAALASNAHATAHSEPNTYDEDSEIHAVEETGSAHIDAQA